MSTWPAVLSALVAGADLTREQSTWAMREVMAGDASPAQVAALAIGLRAKGESADEVGALVDVLLEHARPLHVDGDVVDTCGTGGDRAQTVNISTMAALVVAGAGERVAKHGNRAASSACGTADVLEALGVVVDLPPAGVEACLADAGIAFCFAPVFHPALRHAALPRREVGIATVFNFLGPLCNPARPSAQAVGVSDARMAPVMAGVLAQRGTSALVFRGDDGLDELTTATTSQVWVVRDGAVSAESLDPTRLGVARAAEGALRGGDASTNADVVRRLLDGEPGPVRDAVLLNAAAALAAARHREGDLEDRLAAGLADATAALSSGAAAAVLPRWVSAAQRAKADVSAAPPSSWEHR